jgi:hypothetical protein
MVFVKNGVPMEQQKEAAIERAYQDSYNYFIGEFAKAPTTSTKVRLLSEAEGMNAPVLAKLWQELYSVTIAERKNIAKAALSDAWFAIPRLTKEYQMRKEEEFLNSLPPNKLIIPEAPKRGRKAKNTEVTNG